jgi:hypothetical protein
MLGLRYVAVAIPGKSLKRKTTESDDKREKTQKRTQAEIAMRAMIKYFDLTIV